VEEINSRKLFPKNKEIFFFILGRILPRERNHFCLPSKLQRSESILVNFEEKTTTNLCSHFTFCVYIALNPFLHHHSKTHFYTF
jgi:hypothetical protein